MVVSVQKSRWRFHRGGFVSRPLVIVPLSGGDSKDFVRISVAIAAAAVSTVHRVTTILYDKSKPRVHSVP